jgi:hypothetical protein
MSKKNATFGLMSCLSDYRTRLAYELSSPRLFAQPPRVEFRTQQEHCADCHTPLNLLKTRTRKVVTLHLGAFSARESLAFCKTCGKTHGAEELQRLVPPSSNFGYDVVVYVGKALFLQHRNGQEIVSELAAKNVRMSQSEVYVLGRKFIALLALAHRQSAGRIKEAMSLKGGYMLHLDGTFEGRGPLLMTGMDSMTEIVLGNIKLPSEKAEEIIPFLENIKKLFGAPIALVHDMGKGILNAVKTVFEGIPDFICHYHFLRDLGNGFLEEEYDIIRKRLRKHGITGKLHYRAKTLKKTIDEDPELIASLRTGLEQGKLARASLGQLPALTAYSLIQWALEGKNQGNGYGFPFDRPHLDFAHRLLILAEELEQLGGIELRGDWRDNKPYYRTLRDLKNIANDKTLKRAVQEITRKIEVFDQLRHAMRIAPIDGKQGLNDDAMDDAIQSIEKRVRRFHKELRADPNYPKSKDRQRLVAQTDKYWEKLFADPIEVDTPQGKVPIQPQRTNNIMERFFRDLKRGERRKTGNGRMSRTLRTMLADTPLVKNLENPQYMEILLDGNESLEARFAQSDAAQLRKELQKAQHAPEKVPTIIKRLIQEPTYPQNLKKLLAAAVTR